MNNELNAGTSLSFLYMELVELTEEKSVTKNRVLSHRLNDYLDLVNLFVDCDTKPSSDTIALFITSKFDLEG